MRYPYVKYQKTIPYGSKDIGQVKVFENLVKVQVQGHRVKSIGTKRKISSSGNGM
jgi:hypothetical protein